MWNKTEIKLKQNWNKTNLFQFCFRRSHTWNKTENKTLKQVCFVSVLFQFYFSVAHMKQRWNKMLKQVEVGGVSAGLSLWLSCQSNWRQSWMTMMNYYLAPGLLPLLSVSLRLVPLQLERENGDQSGWDSYFNGDPNMVRTVCWWQSSETATPVNTKASLAWLSKTLTSCWYSQSRYIRCIPLSHADTSRCETGSDATLSCNG